MTVVPSFQGVLQIIYSLRVAEKDLWGTISLVTTWLMLGLKISKVEEHAWIRPFFFQADQIQLPCMHAQLKIEGIRTAHCRFRSCKRCGSTRRSRHRSARVCRLKCRRKTPRLRGESFKDDLRSDRHAVQNGLSRRNLDVCAPHSFAPISAGCYAERPVASLTQ